MKLILLPFILRYYHSFSGRGPWQNHDNPLSDQCEFGHELTPENFGSKSRHVKITHKKKILEENCEEENYSD